MASAVLTVENLTKSYGEKLLFENISFGVNAGDKVALIAKNGYGKSTLLNILTGRELADDGLVTFASEARVAYLPQAVEYAPHQTVEDYIHTAKMPETMDEWTYEQQVEEVLGKLDIRDMGRLMDTLSGGEQKKVALARMLLDDSNFLLLDEPTNHLDITMIEWLEDFLSRQRVTILMVTHDRYFLDHVCSEIIELDNSAIYRYRGTYNYYVEKKAERQNAERAEVERAKGLYRTELEWMRRMPQARGTKARARIDAFYDLEAKAHTRLDEPKMQLSVKTERIGGKILELYNICHQYDGKVLVDDFSYCFKRGEKIGIVGPNGVGKSTLLNIITSQRKPTSGHIVVGQTIKFGYYTQKGLQEREDHRVIDILKDVAEEITLDNGKSMSAHLFLSYFGFDDTTQYNYFGNLSGGEKRRLYLLKVLMANPNFLILDEPTNDLDMYTLEILEDFLRNYKGCLVMVSHDRSFMDNIVDHTFVFEGDGKIRDYPGNYSAYLAAKEQWRKTSSQQKREEKPKYERSKPAKKKATWKEQKEYETLTAEVEQLTAERQQLETLLSGEGSPDEVVSASQRLGDVIAELDAKELRWLELDELINA